MSKAFDCVNHYILLRQLERLGIRCVILKLMESYLTKRKQVTEILYKDKRLNAIKNKYLNMIK